MIIMRCSVCGEKTAKNVYLSNLAPVSLAYCQRCKAAGAEPYHILLNYISNLSDPMNLSQELQEIIKTTLKFIGIKKEQFEKDVMEKINQRNERLIIEKIKADSLD